MLWMKMSFFGMCCCVPLLQFVSACCFYQMLIFTRIIVTLFCLNQLRSRYILSPGEGHLKFMFYGDLSDNTQVFVGKPLVWCCSECGYACWVSASVSLVMTVLQKVENARIFHMLVLHWPVASVPPKVWKLLLCVLGQHTSGNTVFSVSK